MLEPREPGAPSLFDGRREDNASLLDTCSRALTATPWTHAQRRKLRLARALGASPAEALLAVGPGAASPAPRAHAAQACGAPDEEMLATWLRPLHRRVVLVTIARSIDGFLPFECAELLEAAVLRALRAAFTNRTLRVEYTTGTAPPEALRALSWLYPR
jgi:hypothetical protein